MSQTAWLYLSRLSRWPRQLDQGSLHQPSRHSQLQYHLLYVPKIFKSREWKKLQPLPWPSVNLLNSFLIFFFKVLFCTFFSDNPNFGLHRQTSLISTLEFFSMTSVIMINYLLNLIFFVIAIIPTTSFLLVPFSDGCTIFLPDSLLEFSLSSPFSSWVLKHTDKNCLKFL